MREVREASWPGKRKRVYFVWRWPAGWGDGRKETEGESEREREREVSTLPSLANNIGQLLLGKVHGCNTVIPPAAKTTGSGVTLSQFSLKPWSCTGPYGQQH